MARRITHLLSSTMDMEGVASLALLPSGSISGHFVHPRTSTCLGLFGTQIACERECSRGEDYRLINLSIIDFTSKKEKQVVVECRGQDATRFQNATDIHGWEEDVMRVLESNKQGVGIPSVKFECESLKADKDAEEHISRYLPSLIGRDAVVNIGTMKIRGLKFDTTEETQDSQYQQCASQGHLGDENLSSYECHLELEEAPSKKTGDSSSMTISSNAYPSQDNEIDNLVQEELEAEGLSMHKWQEVSSGWRAKR